ncbi:MAG: 1-acyl-sn-glycerol-3-phosphate acyltransferase [Muribaculaceae bacterium]|nr:1-acyl-sn-glycerol-3-phosphate acyltransferase [Muribaculaceae bacterium]
MNIWGLILKLAGWKVRITAPRRNKSIICVAPHTSNWDFILGLCAYHSMGRKANFLMKEFWFFFPLSYLLKYLGGIPVPKRSKKSNLTEDIIKRFESSDYLNLAVTPEGTRSKVDTWRTGFLYISYGADVPIQLGVIDYSKKEIIVEEEFHPLGNVEEDMKFVKDYYSHFLNAGKYPDKFSL